MDLQVRMVSTGQIAYENVMGKGNQEKSDSSVCLGSGSDLKIEAMQ